MNLNISEHVIKAEYGPFKGSTTPMVDLGKCIFKVKIWRKLHLKNRLAMLTSNNYMNHNMFTLFEKRNNQNAIGKVPKNWVLQGLQVLA